jgi:hypothetical protein
MSNLFKFPAEAEHESRLNEGKTLMIGSEALTIVESVKIKERDSKNYEQFVVLTRREDRSQPFTVWNVYNRPMPESTVAFAPRRFDTRAKATVEFLKRVGLLG